MENAQNRIDYFERMLADNPDNPTGLLALANEYGKAGRDEDEAAVLNRYVGAHEDEGNAYLRLGEVLTRLGRDWDATIEFQSVRPPKDGLFGLLSDSPQR